MKSASEGNRGSGVKVERSAETFEVRKKKCRFGSGGSCPFSVHCGFGAANLRQSPKPAPWTGTSKESNAN